MSRTIHNGLTVPQIRLSEHDQKWLDCQNLNHASTHDRRSGVTFLNEVMGMPFKNGAVFKAYNSGEIPTALVSGRACASEYDLARFGLLQKYKPRSRQLNSAIQQGQTS